MVAVNTHKAAGETFVGANGEMSSIDLLRKGRATSSSQPRAGKPSTERGDGTYSASAPVGWLYSEDCWVLDALGIFPHVWEDMSPRERDDFRAAAVAADWAAWAQRARDDGGDGSASEHSV